MNQRPLFRRRKPKFDWYRALLIVAGGCAAIYVAIKVGESSFGWLIP